MDPAEIRSRYWWPLEASHKPFAWEVLETAYGDSGRGYHGWSHISDLFEALDQVSELATRRDLVATAIFWHDAVYVTRAADGTRRADAVNVLDSANLFRRHTLLSVSDADAVHELIMATTDHLGAKPSREHYPGFGQDLDLFVDLDLSPLAAPWEKYAANFQAIRHEFRWVPESAFNAAQGAFLQAILKNHTRLYRRPEAIKKWRKMALSNIACCLHELHTDEVGTLQKQAASK
jgi:predicted metal-dependent HD superfamily phosphohydrolase